MKCAVGGGKKVGFSRGVLLVLLMLCAMAFSGCKKTSAVEGKLVDWNNKPVAGVKITASQVQPIKGYEQFEAVTGGDGSFTLKGLFPSSAYVLKPWSDKWTTKVAVVVDSAPQGETAVLPQPLKISQVYTKSEPVLVADIATGKVGRTTILGKLVDWNGNPVAGIKIIATQERPIKGYEQFEVVTKEDGTFHFSELLASANYVLKPISDTWNSNVTAKVKTPQYHGAEVILPEPMQINQAYAKNGSAVIDLATGAVRFEVSAEGMITDGQTKLEWVVGPDKDTNYAQAMQWVASCQVAGGGWRMPTRMELKTLYQQGVGVRNIDPAFKTTGWWVWAEPRDSSSAWTFYFNNGNEEIWRTRDLSSGLRVFGVRSRPR
jgi:hypothetical protein